MYRRIILYRFIYAGLFVLFGVFVLWQILQNADIEMISLFFGGMIFLFITIPSIAIIKGLWTQQVWAVWLAVIQDSLLVLVFLPGSVLFLFLLARAFLLNRDDLQLGQMALLAAIPSILWLPPLVEGIILIRILRKYRSKPITSATQEG